MKIGTLTTITTVEIDVVCAGSLKTTKHDIYSHPVRGTSDLCATYLKA